MSGTGVRGTIGGGIMPAEKWDAALLRKSPTSETDAVY